jgi:hypothetical protein
VGNRIFYRLEPDRIASALGDFLSTVCPTQFLHRRKAKKERGV